MQFPATRLGITLLLVYLSFVSHTLAQTPSKNRKDEQRENQRVTRAQREWSQMRGELNGLQDSWEKEYRNFLSARGKFLQLKKASETSPNRGSR